MLVCALSLALWSLIGGSLLGGVLPGLSPQGLSASPETAEVGQAVQVVASSADGSPAAAMAVWVVQPDGERIALDAAGSAGATFEPRQVGVHRFEAVAENGARWVLTYEVRPVVRRWLYALSCVPVGLVLLYAAGRRLRRRPARIPSAT